MADRLSGFGRRVLNNGWIKLSAVVLATVAWYAIRGVNSFEQEIKDVPIEILVHEGWAILDRSESTVVVRFRGTRDAVTSLDREQLKVRIDMRNTEKLGSMFVNLSPEDVQCPRSVRPVSIDPGTIYLSLDQEGERTVAVKPSVQGTLPEGYEVLSAVSRPEVVQLYGPRLKLDEVTEVRTEPIDLTGRVESFRARVSIATQSQSWGARVEPSYVQVEVTIVERTAIRELADVTIRALVDPERAADVVMDQRLAAITVQGREEILSSLAHESVRAYVDCYGLPAASTNRLPVRAHLPAGVSVKEIVPAEVEVVVGETDET